MQYDESTHIETHANSAGVVILDKDLQILLVQEKYADAAGLWHIPAGAVEEGEAIEQAAIRECKEETGLDVTLISYINTYVGRFPKSGDLMKRHVWLAKPTHDTVPAPIITEEIAACDYFSMDTFTEMYRLKQIRMYHTKLMFEDALTLNNTLYKF